jgi:copper chaperone CopZ
MSGQLEPDQDTRGRWVTGGAVVAAVLASSCCILPLAFGAAGISTAALAVGFEAARPTMLVVTALLLGAGFYYHYFRKPNCAPGDTCEAPRPRLQRFNRTILWFGTVAVVSLALFPSYATVFTEGQAPPAAAFGQAASEQRVLQLSGMTCEACAVEIQRELASVPGVLQVEVDYPAQEARVVIDAETPPADEELVSAVARTGYSASVAPARDERG